MQLCLFGMLQNRHVAEETLGIIFRQVANTNGPNIER